MRAALSFLCLLLAAGPSAGAPAPFSGKYRGSYELPEASTTVRVTAELTPKGRKVAIRWTEVVHAEGGPPEKAQVSRVTGTVSGRQLRFRTAKRSVFPKTAYTATMQGKNLIVRFPLYYDFEGFYTEEPGRNRERTVREIKMVRQ